MEILRVALGLRREHSGNHWYIAIMKLQLSVAETLVYTCPRGTVPHRHGELRGVSSVNVPKYDTTYR